MNLLHQRRRPACLPLVVEHIRIPVEGIHQRQAAHLKTRAVCIVLGIVTAVKNLQLQLLVRVEVINERDTRHEVAHVVDDLTVLIDLDWVYIILETTVCGTLLTGIQRELLVHLDSESRNVN